MPIMKCQMNLLRCKGDWSVRSTTTDFCLWHVIHWFRDPVTEQVYGTIPDITGLSNNMNRAMRRKPALLFAYAKTAVDQLHRNRADDKRLIASAIRNFKPLAIFCSCTARLVSYLV